ncbi:glycine cleavage system protein GcvH [Candidatus Atelocyanobacterium thalassae]|jgi:glycine cleavage system H protein|uniref:Glycine cleavage system H protein n=1 Tax=Atelocyanobacterium thalassa (isolate ALOHA) TaxID=1453429 RepID=D3EPB9_ATETH|nr:glycine cleavage system protein GcvH [Candidatus Atelocyanobacterium thalassa]ADB95319.1 glycine cleavage system H protein [Candidatus Atelocyanobacterium thalassa isolate ALOHA]MCH2543785.1 glycine cleavage system protein GcvH [Candidatus Atelocyanobacterium sp. ALOHA_A2.5_9]|tara:strand:- start:429 stop:824 length:396 start_codon:yes stop_codon:yes gene_type:complete
MELVLPEDLRFLDSHEYVRLDEKNAVIGISSYAIEQLGDIVFLELPNIGDIVKTGESFGSIESVKAAEELYPPISGIIIDRNETIIENPEKIIDDPYGNGWLLKIQFESFNNELENTLSAEEYKSMLDNYT